MSTCQINLPMKDNESYTYKNGMDIRAVFILARKVRDSNDPYNPYFEGKTRAKWQVGSHYIINHPHKQSEAVFYKYDKYSIDNLLLAHEDHTITGSLSNPTHMEFARSWAKLNGGTYTDYLLRTGWKRLRAKITRIQLGNRVWFIDLQKVEL